MIQLPPFLEQDAAGSWDIYLEVLYGVFQRTLVRGGLTFRGNNVGCRRIPTDKGKHFSFWHLIQEGYPEEDRLPDLERCRRLLWISCVIQNAGRDPAIRVFPQTKRAGDQTWALWLFEQNYVVILAQRSGYYLLKTAFLVESPAKHRDLMRDWQRSQQPQKS